MVPSTPKLRRLGCVLKMRPLSLHWLRNGRFGKAEATQFCVALVGLQTHLLPQSLIAFAGQGLERFVIDDLDDAMGIADCTSRLYVTGQRGDCCAANAEHLGEKLLRQRYCVALSSITGFQ